MNHPFATARAKEQVRQAIAAAERATAAEIVVAVRPKAAEHRHVDYLVGFGFSLLALVVFLFYPVDFELVTMPFESVAAFAIGAVLSAHLPPLRRLLLREGTAAAAVRTAARAMFVDLGVTKTSGRTGLLVYVAAFERRTEVVVDVGVDTRLLGSAFEGAVGAIERAARERDVAAFAEAVAALGPVLGRVLPRAADDVNELPDEVA